jgi:iron complex transport system substrate-binding protein
MPRIVSLLPSATEIVSAIGREEDLVGRSEECDFPPSVRALPAVMRAASPIAHLSSREIDARVRSTRGEGNGLYTLDLELLGSLAPDVILTQDLCRVCSVTDDEVRSACRSAGVAPLIVSLSPTRLEEVWRTVEAIGSAVGAPAAARSLASELRREATPPRMANGRAARVVILEWLDPPILPGLWAPDMIVAAGGEPWGVRPGSPGRPTTWSELAESRPDLVVLSPCSFPVERTRAEATNADVREGLRHLRPARGIWIADEAGLSRPGPRLAAGVTLLRALFAGHPPPPTLPCERYEGLGVEAAR